jgi:hypothetical protein
MDQSYNIAGGSECLDRPHAGIAAKPDTFPQEKLAHPPGCLFPEPRK